MSEQIELRAGEPCPAGQWKIIATKCEPSYRDWVFTLERIDPAPPAPGNVLLVFDGVRDPKKGDLFKVWHGNNITECVEDCFNDPTPCYVQVPFDLTAVQCRYAAECVGHAGGSPMVQKALHALADALAKGEKAGTHAN